MVWSKGLIGCLVSYIRMMRDEKPNFNISSKNYSGVTQTSHFYDSKGKNVGGLQQVFVNPMTLKASQTGVFNIKAPTSDMSGIPTFVRLEYVTTTTTTKE